MAKVTNFAKGASIGPSHPILSTLDIVSNILFLRPRPGQSLSGQFQLLLQLIQLHQHGRRNRMGRPTILQVGYLRLKFLYSLLFHVLSLVSLPTTTWSIILCQEIVGRNLNSPFIPLPSSLYTENIMTASATSDQVRASLQAFQDGYSARDFGRLDEFMALFVQDDGIELIGIGAAIRGGNEWFQGPEQVRDIIEGDWKYWGDVVLDVPGAKITVAGDIAWLSTHGQIVQTSTHDEALPFYMEQMAELLKDESMDHDTRLMEATHYGMRRLRERAKGRGHGWPFTLTAVLQWIDGRWRFHTIHWAMPVD